MFDRFTDHARKAMKLAAQEAFRVDNQYIDTEHILMGLIRENSGVGITVLKNLVDIKKLRKSIEKPTTKVPGTDLRMPSTPAAKTVIRYAVEMAQMLNDSDVGTQHLLLGLLRYPDGAAAAALADSGVKLKQVLVEVLIFLGHKPQEGKS